jgi:hypothetical protein
MRRPIDHAAVTAGVSIAASAWLALAIAAAPASAQRFDLASAKGLELHNVSAEPVTFAGRQALRVTLAPEAVALYERQQAAPPSAPAAGSAPAANDLELLAVVSGSDMVDGTIEIDLAGDVKPGAGAGARGFVGVAFRVQPDARTYDAFYVRPTNGRAEDQERRNHTTQYVSHPDWPWFRLRRETPGRYESYVDIQPGKWIHLEIEVRGEKARLYVDGAEQPTLIVNDVKSGAGTSGRVALWIEGSTIAHFANLVVTRATPVTND